MDKVWTNSPAFAVLQPHPRWRWGVYPLRWFLGGCWSLWRLPLRGTLYGLVYFGVVLAWQGAATRFDDASVALAATLSGLCLLLTPRLTAELIYGVPPSLSRPFPEPEVRHLALLGLGTLLLIILALTCNAAVASFVLLYSGDARLPDGLLAALLAWRNLPLAVALLALIFLAGLAMQLVATLGTFLLLRQPRVDPYGTVRTSVRIARGNWRPLASWSLASQLLLLLGVAAAPVSLVLLAPLVACGSWWACREMTAPTRQH